MDMSWPAACCAEPEFHDTLLVALTGYGQDSDQQLSHEAGFDLHLVKPPTISTLKEVFAHPKLSRLEIHQ